MDQFGTADLFSFRCLGLSELLYEMTGQYCIEVAGQHSYTRCLALAVIWLGYMTQGSVGAPQIHSQDVCS